MDVALVVLMIYVMTPYIFLVTRPVFVWGTGITQHYFYTFTSSYYTYVIREFYSLLFGLVQMACQDTSEVDVSTFSEESGYTTMAVPSSRVETSIPQASFTGGEFTFIRTYDR